MNCLIASQVSRMREEGDVSKLIFRDRTERITKRLNLMNQRYADLERRRHLELEGFQTDIKTLREKMRKVERRLYKVSRCLQRVDVFRFSDDKNTFELIWSELTEFQFLTDAGRNVFITLSRTSELKFTKAWSNLVREIEIQMKDISMS